MAVPPCELFMVVPELPFERLQVRVCSKFEGMVYVLNLGKKAALFVQDAPDEPERPRDFGWICTEHGNTSRRVFGSPEIIGSGNSEAPLRRQLADQREFVRENDRSYQSGI